MAMVHPLQDARCVRCYRTVGDHAIYHDGTPEGAPEAVFPKVGITPGLICPHFCLWDCNKWLGDGTCRRPHGHAEDERGCTTVRDADDWKWPR